MIVLEKVEEGWHIIYHAGYKDNPIDIMGIKKKFIVSDPFDFDYHSENERRTVAETDNFEHAVERAEEIILEYVAVRKARDHTPQQVVN